MEADLGLIAAVVVAVLVIFLTALYLRRVVKPSVKRDVALLIGPAGAGKTTLMSLLCTGEVPRHGTVTSMAPQRAMCVLRHKGAAAEGGAAPRSVPLVDIPGHARLRRQMLLSHAPSCACLVFVIDSVAFDAELSDVAELLYDTLAALPGRPALIVCNKQDMFFRASKPDAIRTKLEAEFNAVRKTRAATLDSTDDDPDEAAVGSAQLGDPSVPFRFDDLGSPVEFVPFAAGAPKKPVVAGAAANDGAEELADPAPLHEWLAGHV